MDAKAGTMTLESNSPPRTPRRWLRICGVGVLLVVLAWGGFAAYCIRESQQRVVAIARLQTVAHCNLGHSHVLPFAKYLPAKIQSRLPRRSTVHNAIFKTDVPHPGRYLRDVGPEHFGLVMIPRTTLTREDIEVLSRAVPLSSLTIRECQFEAGALTLLTDLPNLTSLELLSCTFAPTDEIDFPSMPKLWQVDLSHSTFQDGVLRQLAGHPSLVRIDLTSTPVTEDGLQLIRHLPCLRYLDLRDTRITGLGLSGLDSPLTHLNLKETAANDTTVEILTQWHTLRSVNLANTHVTVAGVRLLCQLPKIEELILDGCPVGDVREMLEKVPTMKHWSAEGTR